MIMVFKKIRKEILERDNFSCLLCKKNLKKFTRLLHIHHLDENPNNNKKDNLITLCKDCHLSKVHAVMFGFIKDKENIPILKKYLPLAYARLTTDSEEEFRRKRMKFIRGELPMPTQEQTIKLNKELGIE